jgi:fucose permease
MLPARSLTERLLMLGVQRVGEKKLVFVLCVGTIVFQLLVWFIPNVIGESGNDHQVIQREMANLYTVAVAIVGLLIGPMYPCAQTVFTRLLPGNLQVFAIGFISSMGSSGGAVVPFLTGLIAQAAGTFVLHPIVIAFVGVMIVGWAALPRVAKRDE